MILESRRVRNEGGGVGRQVQQRSCDGHVLLDCFGLFSRKSVEQKNRPTFSPSALLFLLHALPSSLRSCSPSLQGRPLERLCVCAVWGGWTEVSACVIPHMVDFIILPARSSSCGGLIHIYTVCMCVGALINVTYRL